jgi:hypothetical protein
MRRENNSHIHQLIANYSDRAGEPIGDWLRRAYVEESWSYSQITASLGIKGIVSLHKLLAHFGIERRRRSEVTARGWHNNPERRAAQRQAFVKGGLRRPPISAEEHAAHQRARQILHAAIRQGDVPRANTLLCRDCGANAMHYHHESYDLDRSLDVIPLCPKCHDLRHR